MATLITKNSSTAAAAPLAADLTQGELAVNVTDKKLYSKDSGGAVVKLVGGLGNQEANAVAITGGAVNGTTVGATTASTGAFTTLAASGAVTLSGGTANGVTYLNGSKVLTSGSALQFNGSQFGVNTTPAQAIDVVTDGASSIIRSTAYRAADGQAGINLRFARGSVASPTIVLTGDTIGTMEFYPYNGTNFNLQTALISAKVTGTVTTSNIPTALVFGLDAAGAAYSNEQMRLTSTGLGIGTSSPVNKLQVAGAVAATGGAGGYAANMALLDVSGGNAQITAIGANTSTVGTLVFQAFSSNASLGGERARIDSSGNMGIGTTSPSDYFSTASKFVIANTSGDVGMTIATSSTGTGNIFWADATSGTGEYSGYIQYAHNGDSMRFGTNGAERARIDSSGNLLVGLTSTVLSSKILSSFNGATQNGIVLDDPNSTSAAGFIAMSIGNGTYCGSVSRVGSTSAVVYTATSDRRLKENIVDAPSALAHINSVKVRSFNWIDGGHQIKYGVIAQEFFDVEPDAVIQGDSGETIEKTWSVDTSALVPAMIKAIQEQQALITQLQADIATLKG